MNILLISQCKKNALTQTRRIIDQFAERCGERTWQTAMTKAGLITLHKLLRKTARKNSAIACYWTHGKNKTELLWIVGNKSQFNQQGRVPTNRTQRNILSSGQEDNWQHATSIQLISTIAALLHDLGKATIGFQTKLTRSGKFAADPFRHEWISLQLFCLMIQGCKTDQEVFKRLANFSEYQTKNPNWYQSLIATQVVNLSDLPTLTKWIAWLIVSHHRMPFLNNSINGSNDKQKNIYLETAGLTQDNFFQSLEAVARWVKNSYSTHERPDQFWTLKASVTDSENWLKKLTRYATKALHNLPLMQLKQVDAFLLHVSRLSLMVGDHNYSSLPCDKHEKHEKHDKQNFTQGEDDKTALIANTDHLGKAKQHLDQHLIGVADFTARFAKLLPKITTELPAIQQHKAFTQRATISKFQWQNHAFDIAKQHQSKTDECGFFGVNMASTGCGKTLANARIIYALANPKRGVRFTIALGLRVLTLQTGQALRKRLALNDEHQIAILVGGRATKTLFNLNNNENQQSDVNQIYNTQNRTNLNSDDSNRHHQQNFYGSESADELVDGFVDISESGIADHELGTIIENSNANKLLNAPIVTCTVDHIIQASECLRGGKYIPPSLRLLTSNMIFDEPDDFDQKDLPALARLIHLAGLLGSKVLLSSATLTPDLVSGLFDAYQSGRQIWNQNNQNSQQGKNAIVCGWFDEYQQSMQEVNDRQMFDQQHKQFVQKRISQLQKAAVQRQGKILELLDYSSDRRSREKGEEINYGKLANQLLTQAQRFHDSHAQLDKNSGKSISIGLIRFSRTEDIIEISKKMYQQTDIPTDTQFHLVVYHARQLLLLRSQLEEKLDCILNRNKANAIFSHTEIIKATENSDYSKHIFIVIGTPVTEVGRDHDYDWAMIEPSSMRSIIQLVGRVWRHRSDKVATEPNVAILGTNIESIKRGNNLGIGEYCFNKPGFETQPFLLASHKSQELITAQQLENINAIPRIENIAAKTDMNSKAKTFAELEHKVMQHLFPTKPNYVSSYWQPDLAHHYCVHLQMISKFREDGAGQCEYVCQIDDDGKYKFSFAEAARKTPNECSGDTQNQTIEYKNWQFNNPQVVPWLTNSVENALTKLDSDLNRDNKIKKYNRYQLANEFCTVNLFHKHRWLFHPYFGFYKNKQ